MQRFENIENPRNRQTGMLTVFTAVLVLIVLTLMIFYASRSGLFEQRISANEVRQKTAFHAAEAAIDQAAEYLLANKELLLSDWRAESKWSSCNDYRSNPNHPCGGNTPMPLNSYFYDDDVTGYELMTVTVPVAANGVTARVTANMCKVNLNDATIPKPCVLFDDPTPGGEGTFMVLTVMGYGYSDCTDTTDVTTCQGRASVAKPLGNFTALAGAPTVPLVTKSAFPPNGTALVVPNPNAGGVGVPISAWVNNNPSDFTDPISGRQCPQDAEKVLDDNGTWNTCEMQEWYEQEAVPAGVVCDQSTCSCTNEESISYKLTGQLSITGIDIVFDETFPCDLFQTFFKVKDTNYESIKNSIPQQIDATDCDTEFGPTSSGLYWVSGEGTCDLNGDPPTPGSTGTIGSPDNPVVIISAANNTRINGKVNIFGVLYVFDGEVETAEFSGSGTPTIYGALIVDADMNNFTGTTNVVYSDGVLLKAADLGGFGEINGGWRDFGLPEVSW